MQQEQYRGIFAFPYSKYFCPHTSLSIFHYVGRQAGFTRSHMQSRGCSNTWEKCSKRTTGNYVFKFCWAEVEFRPYSVSSLKVSPLLCPWQMEHGYTAPLAVQSFAVLKRYCMWPPCPLNKGIEKSTKYQSWQPHTARWSVTHQPRPRHSPCQAPTRHFTHKSPFPETQRGPRITELTHVGKSILDIEIIQETKESSYWDLALGSTGTHSIGYTTCSNTDPKHQWPQHAPPNCFSSSVHFSWGYFTFALNKNKIISKNQEWYRVWNKAIW